MAIYAIGDIQGCFDALQNLLKEIQYNPEQDQLWFVGDLINRGPKNIETLRFIKSLGDGAVVTLGNHDLHLLAVAYGHREINKRNDTFEDVVNAIDFDDIIDWLRRRPILHHEHGYTMVHAGLPPQWNLSRAQKSANEIQQVLRSDLIEGFLANMYGNEPSLWDDTLTGWDRLRYITNSFTRLRFCEEDGREDFTHNQHIGSQPDHLMPWYECPHRENNELKIIFGHWAALGHHLQENIFALDSGCVWGGKMTAMHVDEKPAFYQVPCA